MYEGVPRIEAGVRQTAIVLDALGQPEIGDVRLVFVIEQDVRRFQVAVQDPAQVCIDGRPEQPRSSAARWLADRP